MLQTLTQTNNMVSTEEQRVQAVFSERGEHFELARVTHDQDQPFASADFDFAS